MEESSASSQPSSPGQQVDDMNPGTALIEARIMELQREQGYFRFFFPQDSLDGQAQHTGGDTLVQIYFPSNGSVRCDGTAWSNVQIRMSAEQLLATKSDVFKEKLAEVTPQMRERRQQDYLGPMLPEGVKYILNLTPPDMGDDLAALVTILSVPESVRSWWQSGLRLNIKRSLVSGHDDACSDHDHVPDDCERLPGVSSVATEGQPQTHLPVLDLDDIVGPVVSRQIPDYCPIRHRANIIFIMEAILCGDIHSVLQALDSATRVYTVVKLAKLLDCVNVVLDPVYCWALAHPSGNFIELLPEVSLGLFWDLKIVDIVRSTFSILVVEGAIELLGAPTDPGPNAAAAPNTSRIGPTTIFGRKRDAVPEDISNTLEHARDSLAERTHTTLAHIKSDGIYDLLSQNYMANKGIPEWDRLSNIAQTLGCIVPGRSADASVNPPVPVLTAISEYQQICLPILREAYDTLASALVAYFHNQMAESFNDDDCDFSQANLDRKCYVPQSRFTHTSVIYRRLTAEQRALTMYPWYKMMAKANTDTKSHFDSLPVNGSTIAQLSADFNKHLLHGMRLFPALMSYHHIYLEGEIAFFSLETFRTQYIEAMGCLHNRRKLGSLEGVDFLARSQHMALGAADKELFLLPMWAGGNDDELGGVYDSGFIPDTADGPSGPGPAFHTGHSVATAASSIAPSTPTIGRTTDDDDMTTVGRSIVAAVSSSSNSSTVAVNNHGPVRRPSREAEPWNSDDFMLETTGSEDIDDFDLAESGSDDNFPLD
ncbi:hypothetical protein PG993_003528 [Apiospora rasikravindrae]|uniref:Uncharacterized protein n=1 Tax=Apiospora rasikravindrae TaxID=990691 RepID=A0ABR1U2H9_9PEZI